MEAPAGPSHPVKLLLDVHHSPQAARRLQNRGLDVLAAADDSILAVLDDEELLRAATRDGRVVVTENARDFDRIIRAWSALGEQHKGITFTSPRRFHRGSKAYPENLIRALGAVLKDPPQSTLDWVWWLGPDVVPSTRPPGRKRVPVMSIWSDAVR